MLSGAIVLGHRIHTAAQAPVHSTLPRNPVVLSCTMYGVHIFVSSTARTAVDVNLRRHIMFTTCTGLVYSNTVCRKNTEKAGGFLWAGSPLLSPAQ